ncbi:SH3 domain-containing protein [Devosia sp. CAU 1758]
MRALTRLAIATLAAIALATPALALTITARVAGGNIAVHAGPDDRFDVVGYVRDGEEIPIDSCTQVDSDSRRGTWFGDAGHTLWPSGATQWCRIPDYGWVNRAYLTGRGLVNVTPPDFLGPGW